MTPAQINTLKTFVAQSSDPAIIAARTSGATYDLALLLSAPSATRAWRTSAPAADLDDAATYTTFDGLAQGKRDEWAIFLQYAPRDMSKAKNRNVVTDVWGPAIAASVSESVLTAGTEFANVAEAAIGGPQRTTGTVAALARNYVGEVSQDDVRLILAA